MAKYKKQDKIRFKKPYRIEIYASAPTVDY